MQSASRLKLHIVAAALPPALDAIGHYTALLAAELARSAAVKLLTGTGSPHAPIPGVAIEPVFSVAQRHTVRQIARSVEADPPDWLLVQYNPFCYGRWGLNPYLPLVLRALRRRRPRTGIALMVHETFVPVTDWKFAIETTWQRWQLRVLGRNADVLFFAIEPWARQFQAWFPRTPILHLPVGSNVPLLRTAPAETRRRLGIPAETVVLGLFGTAHASRLLEWVRLAAEAVLGAGREVLVLYVGPHGPAVRRQLEGLPTLAVGPLPGDEVSRHFAAFDIYLAPFVDGVSTRRGSLMAGLQHGVASVATRGPSTDRMLLEADGSALLLADVRRPGDFAARVLQLVSDAHLRARIGGAGQELYHREFAWEPIACRLLAGLRRSEPDWPYSRPGLRGEPSGVGRGLR